MYAFLTNLQSWTLTFCQVFDAADGSWSTHLNAAKSLFSRTDGNVASQQSTHFLSTWFAYHDMLSDFSFSTAKGDSSILITSISPTNAQIVGSVGCSMQVLQCISSINKLATILEQNSPDLPNIIEKQARDLENQLTNFVHIPSIIEDTASGRLDTSRTTRAAELYRLGALIYLHRSLLRTPTRSSTMQSIVGDSLQILGQNSICTSPWPLFMIACEVVSDRDRIQILSTIEAMQEKRRIGNVDVIREVIEAVWKQSDLQEDSKGRLDRKRIDWKDVVEIRPSFI